MKKSKTLLSLIITAALLVNAVPVSASTGATQTAKHIQGGINSAVTGFALKLTAHLSQVRAL